jgi:hypothetical protein
MNERLIRKRFCSLALVLIACIIVLAPNAPSPSAQSLFGRDVAASDAPLQSRQRRAPVLGADMTYADYPWTLIDAWKDKAKSDAMYDAFRSAGIRSLRFSSHGFYSAEGVEATRTIKADNKLPNQFTWFPLDEFVEYIATHDTTAVIGINVEEGPDVANRAVQKFLNRGLKSKLVAIELSNEPWLSYRPWHPEAFADKAASVIQTLTPLGIPFALPLTVGKEKKTPTKLSDDEWNRRMLTALSTQVDLRTRSDIYGVAHLYGRGVNGRTIETFNKAVNAFLPHPRYLVTEFNIKSSLAGNPHLTNKYALEFAMRLADVMSRPEVAAMYVHSVPYHSVAYWSDGKKLATVIGQSDPKLTGSDLNYGWHLTPAGKVYGLYSRIAWNGEVVEYHASGKQSYWSVRTSEGRFVTTFVNAADQRATRTLPIAGQKLKLDVPPQSIVCVDSNGREIERLQLTN